jgi:hypothetical protein
MSQQQLLLKEKLSISQILRAYGKQLRRLLGDTLMDVMVDVPLVSSCRIMAGMAGMAGMVKMIHMLQ